MENQYFDIAIVGQGIAGTLLGHFLENYGLKVLVIDNHHEGSSSMVAAGVVNPITGKKFVKSWRIDDLLPVARETYDDIEDKFGVNCYTEANILWALETIEQENSWLARTQDSLYSSYITQEVNASEMEDKVTTPFYYGEITRSFYVHFKNIIQSYKEYWSAKGGFLDEYMVINQLKRSEGSYNYKNYHFQKIVFCEGYKAISNPYFQDLELQPAKGEVLLVKIPDANFSKIYKDKIFLVHQYDDVYWVGSNYEWNFPSDQPTPQARQVLINELDRILTVPYQIIDHQAAVRPTTANRRPLMKIHYTYPGMYLFNGLGTKGGSLGPLFAKQFARYIMDGDPEDLKY